MLFHAEEKIDEVENLPSLEALETTRNKVVKSIPNYFGGEDEEDIPDLADIEETDNVIDADPVWLPYPLSKHPCSLNLWNVENNKESILYNFCVAWYLILKKVSWFW